MVAASLGGRRLRRFRARGLKLRRLSRKSRVDQLEAAGAVFFGLKIDRVERGLRQLGLAPKRLLLRLKRVQVAPKLVEAASIGIGVADREFGRRGGRAPICRLLSRRVDDAFDGRTDRLDTGVDDGLDAGCRQHRSQRRPAQRDHEPNPQRDLKKAPRHHGIDEALGR